MPDVKVEQHQRVLLVTFDRAPVINASTPEMIGGWLAALESAAHDPSIGAVVTAATGQAWCAGADLPFLLRHQRSEPGRRRRLDALGMDLIAGAPEGASSSHPALSDIDDLGLNAMAAYLAEYPKPLIAGIDGAVAGGGVPLALLHHVRLVGAAASFRTSFAALGLISELGMGYLLPRVAGTGVALDLCLSGRVVRGEELVRLGLAERFVAEGSAVEAALSYAEDIGQLPPAQVTALLRLLRRSEDMTWTEYLRSEWQHQRDAFDSEEACQRVDAVAARLGVQTS